MKAISQFFLKDQRQKFHRGDQHVVEARRHGCLRCVPTRKVGPRLEEVHRAARVYDRVVHRLAEHDSATAQVHHLHKQQRARQVRHLVSWTSTDLVLLVRINMSFFQTICTAAMTSKT
jgi:hypothetical protein